MKKTIILTRKPTAPRREPTGRSIELTKKMPVRKPRGVKYA